MRRSHADQPSAEPGISVAEDLIREIGSSAAVRSNAVRHAANRQRKRQQKSVAPAASPQPIVVLAPEPAAAEAQSRPIPTAPPVPETAPALPEFKVAEPAAPPAVTTDVASPPMLAVFYYYDPDSAIGRYVTRIMPLVAARQIPVHIFSRKQLDIAAEGVHVHVIGEGDATDLLASSQQFATSALAAFDAECGSTGARVTALGFEWVSVKLLLELERRRQASIILSLHSLESQRSDLSNEQSRTIQAMELEGLAKAQTILIHNPPTAEEARKLLPQCQTRLVPVPAPFPVDDFRSGLDPGAVKARFQIGPIDPTILFIGELDDRHGPDILVKASEHIFKNQPQARFVVVGDGALQWPLRVHARYLRLEHAIRLAGHLAGKELHELIEASDIVCVPSRETTEDWPILAAWAAKRPVVATHNIGDALIQHDHDGVLFYPSENSCVWAVERLLRDHELRRRLGQNGHDKLVERYGWGKAAVQLQELMGVRQATAVGI